MAMKQDHYLGSKLHGNEIPTSRDGREYRVVVESETATSEENRQFTEATFITRTAIATSLLSRPDDNKALEYLEMKTFSKARARLALQLYKPGDEYVQEIYSQTQQSEVKDVSNQYIQRSILGGLKNIRKSDPFGYKNIHIDVDGFCYLLSIEADSFFYNVSLLVEDNLIEVPGVYETCVNNGSFYITNKGIGLLEKELGQATNTSQLIPKASSMSEHEYDVAISFAGEDRSVAEELAKNLREKGVRVFYDNFEQDELWGKNLYDHLSRIYSDSARFCIILISSHYSKKTWPNFERQNAQARALREAREYILPIRLDDTKIPGLTDTVGYVTYRDTPIKRIVEMICNNYRNCVIR